MKKTPLLKNKINCSYKFDKGPLILNYISYLADAPVSTTEKYSRATMSLSNKRQLEFI